MKKFQQPPLKIICAGLSPEKVDDLADKLSSHFFDVNVYGDTIYADRPRDFRHYEAGWHILDKLGVKVI